MIEVRETPLREGTLAQELWRDGERLTFGEVLDGWAGDAEVRQATARSIAGAPFDAVFWECPPITLRRLALPFEQVVVDAPQLARVSPDREAFSAHFGDDAVTAFDNLGGDARLVVPAPIAEDGVYPHLAACVRRAPTEQVHALFERLGRELAARLQREDPVWCSTSGLGVYWVHIRLDTRPKYYTHGPYRAAL